MLEEIYVLTFESDCTSYYFYHLENAKESLWKSFLFENEKELLDKDLYLDELNNNKSIEGFAYIDKVFMEDER